MFYRISLLGLLIFIACSNQNFAQSKRVLFLGNSYTGVNNLPLLFKNVALSTNDTVIVDSNTPGGYTLQGHSTNATSLNKIQAGNWDYVVLQEQSQLPSFPDDQVAVEVFPYARTLDSIINQYSPCVETVFYRTWGRKIGDASNCTTWPPVCTYEGMDSLLHLRYMKMAFDNNALISPAGSVWKLLRTTHPEIELYSTDGSHPSVAGSYATACAFYSVILRKNPENITFNNGLPDSVAHIIRAAAKNLVYDSLSKWFVGKYDPVANFNYSLLDNTASFQNSSTAGDEYVWDFGDRSYDTQSNPSHTYTQSGSYIVTLTSSKCGRTSQRSVSINIIVLQSADEIRYYPNPVKNMLTLYTNAALKGKKYLLYNQLGQFLKSDMLQTNYTSIDLSTLASGVYIIKFENAIVKPISVIKF